MFKSFIGKKNDDITLNRRAKKAEQQVMKTVTKRILRSNKDTAVTGKHL